MKRRREKYSDHYTPLTPLGAKQYRLYAFVEQNLERLYEALRGADPEQRALHLIRDNPHEVLNVIDGVKEEVSDNRRTKHPGIEQFFDYIHNEPLISTSTKDANPTEVYSEFIELTSSLVRATVLGKERAAKALIRFVESAESAKALEERRFVVPKGKEALKLRELLRDTRVEEALIGVEERPSWMKDGGGPMNLGDGSWQRVIDAFFARRGVVGVSA